MVRMFFGQLVLCPRIKYFKLFFSYSSIFAMRGSPTYIVNALLVTLLPGSVGLGLLMWSHVMKRHLTDHLLWSILFQTLREPPAKRKHLQALTLVGPTRDNLVLHPVAVLQLTVNLSLNCSRNFKQRYFQVTKAR